jgi:hypothetical protein
MGLEGTVVRQQDFLYFFSGISLIYPPGSYLLNDRRKRDMSYFDPKNNIRYSVFAATSQFYYGSHSEEPQPPVGTQ